MSKRAGWSAKDLAKALRKQGAELVRMKGSHAMYRFEGCQSVVPMHGGDVPAGTVRAVERDFEPVFGKGWLVK